MTAGRVSWRGPSPSALRMLKASRPLMKAGGWGSRPASATSHPAHGPHPGGVRRALQTWVPVPARLPPSSETLPPFPFSSAENEEQSTCHRGVLSQTPQAPAELAPSLLLHTPCSRTFFPSPQLLLLLGS